MEKYEYKVVKLKFSIWKQKAEADYLEVLNDYGQEGWRFVDFAPKQAVPDNANGNKIEMIFERRITT